MERSILLADMREISRAGLRNVFVNDPQVTSIEDASTQEELRDVLSTCLPSLIIIHQSMINDFADLPCERCVILATEPDEAMLFAAYANRTRGYLLESSPMDLIRMTLRLSEEMFLLDPSLTPWLIGCINKDVLPKVTKEILTIREQEIFRLLRTGITNRAIGLQLCISETTVKSHVSNIFRKLDIKRRSVVMYTPTTSMQRA